MSQDNDVSRDLQRFLDSVEGELDVNLVNAYEVTAAGGG